jgi:hypothetical protein
MTKIIKLQVVSPSKVEKRTIFSTDDKAALVKGVELESHVCGCCGFVLAENVMTYNYRDIILQCPNCKSYNEAPNNEHFIT